MTIDQKEKFKAGQDFKIDPQLDLQLDPQLDLAQELELLKKTIRLAREGDAPSIKILVEKYQVELSKFAYYLTRDREEALDLAQHTFVKILEGLKELREVDRFKSWMFSVCRNLFLDTKRKKRELLTEDQNPNTTDEERAHLNSQSSSNDRAHDGATHLETVILVKYVMNAMEDDDRLLLLLVDRDGMSYSEAAEVFSMSESAVKSMLFRAREKFKKKWEEAETIPPRETSPSRDIRKKG